MTSTTTAVLVTAKKMSLARLRCISMVTSKDGKPISKQAPMTKKGARSNDASSIKVFGTKCEAIVYEYTGYKGWKATFKTGVYPFNALNAKGAKNDIVSSIMVQKVADEKMEMDTPPNSKSL